MAYPRDDAIQKAAAALRSGKLIILPTETVYGLGGDARDADAVAAIFAAKGRPRFNPLIVHVPDIESARQLAQFTPLAEALAGACWPGALTLVLKRRMEAGLCDLVSAGLDTVALRVPGHAAARRVLRSAGCPVAAPSANRSGRISPTTAEAAEAELGDAVAAIVDAGPCDVGLESTVIDATGAHAVLLREGGVPRERIERAMGQPILLPGDSTAIASPGMLASHYAPTIPLILVPPGTVPEHGDALLTYGPVDPGLSERAHSAETLSESEDLTEAAARLYGLMRMLDASGAHRILAHQVPEIGLGRAINDRLRRAATASDG